MTEESLLRGIPSLKTGKGSASVF